MFELYINFRVAGCVSVFFLTHILVHLIGLTLAAPFFMMKHRIESLLRTIDKNACLLSPDYCPLVPLCNGEQIASWLALFRFEKLVMKLKFSEGSLPLGTLFLCIIALGLVLLVNALLFPNDTAITIKLMNLSAYLVIVATFFISTFAFAAMISSVHDELPLRVREQQMDYVLQDKPSSSNDDDGISFDIDDALGLSADRIPRDPEIAEQLEKMIAYLETNSDTFKLLKVIPANFVVLNLIGGYAATMLISVFGYVGAFYGTRS